MTKFPSELMRIFADLGVDVGDGTLLTLALTHKSWIYENRDKHGQDNERLEFLGDAVIGLIVSEALYNDFPTAPEGDLARMKSATVCEKSLATAGKRLRLGDALKLGVGEERSGGRQRPSLLANAYEAVTGAVFLLSDWNKARRFVLHTLSPELHNARRSPGDPKSRLQELLQARSQNTPTYRLVDSTGPDHDKRFISEVLFEGKTLGRGEGKSKRASERAAATQALRKLK